MSTKINFKLKLFHINTSFFLKLVVLTLLVLTLSACQTLLLKNDEAVNKSKPVEDKQTEVEYPHHQLTGELLYDFLIAAIAYDNADYDKAYKIYLRLMTETSDPRLNKLVIKAALASKNNEYMLHAAELWEKIEPGNTHINQIKSAVLINLKRDAEAADSLEDVILSAKDSKDGFKKIEMFISPIKSEKRINFIFSKLQQKFRDDFYLYVSWAKFLSHYKDGHDAISKIDKALSLNPNNTLALLIKLEIYKKFNGADNLEAIYLDAVNAAESPVMVRLEYAKYLLDRKQNLKSLEQLEIITETVKDNRRILYEVALLALEIKEYQTALKFFKQYYEFKSEAKVDEEEQSKVAYAIAKVLLEKKKYQEALSWFNKVSYNDYVYQAALNKILIYAELKNFQKSIEILSTLSPQKEEQKRTLSRLKGDIYFQSKSYQKAFDAYSQSIAIHSYEANKDEYIELYYNRALTAEKLDLINEMEQDLLYILKKEPNNSNVLNTLGFLLTEKTKRYKEAQSYIERALKLNPNDMATIDSMGWVLYQQGSLEKALHYLEKAYKLDQDPEISAHYGEVLWQLDNRELAKKVWQKAITKNPEHQILKKTIERFLKEIN
ncbi:MAG: tetratricopeptide repeat protein [Gammaproteobacteria bacterium]|nr:tetratricopeptide repeat protein [Gammaproteobacteria bacterium]